MSFFTLKLQGFNYWIINGICINLVRKNLNRKLNNNSNNNNNVFHNFHADFMIKLSAVAYLSSLIVEISLRRKVLGTKILDIPRIRAQLGLTSLSFSFHYAVLRHRATLLPRAIITLRTNRLLMRNRRTLLPPVPPSETREFFAP